eukprot:TRINITY_DN13415_c0_g1_i1.p1 TRINITY_DN13415_c0_g1~~TRINITY_DN13415_c0_g1_i1.p1  ORF type:complete len:103 (-),score=13.91 TRINITY_DN13415_c0_g1_i1:13-321(-)
MLHPKEDRTRKVLELVCRNSNCGFREDASDPCIYRNNIREMEEERTIAWADIPSDPALQRTNARCSKCNNNEAVLFQVLKREGVTLYLVCTNPNCANRWVQD